MTMARVIPSGSVAGPAAEAASSCAQIGEGPEGGGVVATGGGNAPAFTGAGATSATGAALLADGAGCGGITGAAGGGSHASSPTRTNRTAERLRMTRAYVKGEAEVEA